MCSMHSQLNFTYTTRAANANAGFGMKKRKNTKKRIEEMKKKSLGMRTRTACKRTCRKRLMCDAHTYRPQTHSHPINRFHCDVCFQLTPGRFSMRICLFYELDSNAFSSSFGSNGVRIYIYFLIE